MLKKELILISICAVIGLVAGFIIYPVVGMREFYGYILAPLYGIGFIYGIRLILTALKKMLAAFSKASLTSIAMKNLIGFLIVLILGLLALAVVVFLGWIAGIFMAIYRVVQAIRLDRSAGVGRNSGSSYDDDWSSPARGYDGRRKRGWNPDEDDDSSTWDDDDGWK